MSCCRLSICFLLLLTAIDCPDIAHDVKIEAVPGENVTLLSTSDLNWTSFECRRDSSYVVLFRQNKMMPGCCPQFEGRVQVLRDVNLSVVLTNVTYKDCGVYNCELEAKHPRVFSIILKVVENKTIDAKPGDNVTLLSTAQLNWTSLECSRNSSLVVKFRQNNTRPDYGPLFKGRVQVLRDVNLSVVLTNVTYKDSGVYICDLEPPHVFSIILNVVGGAGQPAVWIFIAVVLCIFIVFGVVVGVVHREKVTEWFRNVTTEDPQTVPPVQYRAVSNGLNDPVTVPIEGGDHT